jgi:EAL domain-containing protein (putative c-di-GMP-specific phosphodiesterase class I)
LLRQAAARIVECIGSDNFAASFSADDFAVIAYDLGDDPQTASNSATALGQALLASLRRIFEIGEYRCRATASIGIAVFGHPTDTSDELLKHVDLAMYKAKESGRDTLRLFDGQMQQSVNQRAQLEDDLRRALEQNQFELHIQAQFNTDLAVVGAEALVRWRHPERGLVSPASFIDLAEQTGLILPIGRWVLQTACALLKRWDAHPVLRNLPLAVNISALQLYQTDFVNQTLSTLRQTGADPNRLKLEITESLLLKDIEIAITRMKELREQGVRFSLDDFGTGYSSLSYLYRLPLDQLKIDQSFIRNSSTDPDARAITRGIISLGTNLGLEVIAEGVETQEQVAFLKESGCGLFQGYFLSKPLPVAEFLSLCEGG